MSIGKPWHGYDIIDVSETPSWKRGNREMAFKITGREMKRDLSFLVTVNGMVIAAFMHHSAAVEMADKRQREHPHANYQVELSV